jgi:hypothetical protein
VVSRRGTIDQREDIGTENSAEVRRDRCVNEAWEAAESMSRQQSKMIVCV